MSDNDLNELLQSKAPTLTSNSASRSVLASRRRRSSCSVEVGPKVHQPYGILHGGVSALLAEGAASIGGVLSVGPDEIVVGTELNCSHLRSMSSGTLTATATPIRKGRSVHVWGIELARRHGPADLRRALYLAGFAGTPAPS